MLSEPALYTFRELMRELLREKTQLMLRQNAARKLPGSPESV